MDWYLCADDDLGPLRMDDGADDGVTLCMQRKDVLICLDSGRDFDMPPSCTDLDISGYNAGWFFFFQSLSLSLLSCNVEMYMDYGAWRISRMLSRNTTLKMLDLCGTYIPSESWIHSN